MNWKQFQFVVTPGKKNLKIANLKSDTTEIYFIRYVNVFGQMCIPLLRFFFGGEKEG